MALRQIFIIVDHQMRKKADATMSFSSTFKMAINHKSDTQIAVIECFLYNNIFKIKINDLDF